MEQQESKESFMNKLNSREAMIVTNYSCDKRCAYCFNEPHVFNYRGQGRTILKDYKKVSDKLKGLRVSKVYVTGGEPSLRQDLPSILSDLSEFKITLSTNGNLFKKYSAAQIASFGLRGINLSIDAFGHGGFGDTLRDQDNTFIPQLMEFYKNRGKTQLSLLTTISTRTVPHLEKFFSMDFVRQADRVVFQSLCLPQNHALRQYALDSVPVDKRIKIIQRLKHLFPDEELRMRIFEEYYSGGGNFPPCSMGLRYFQVDPDGQVFGCPHNKSVIISKNILEDSLQDIEANLLRANKEVFGKNLCLESKCICMYAYLLGKDQK